MKIAVVNRATRIASAEAAKMTSAVQLQLDTQVSLLWERLPPSCSYFADPLSVPGDHEQIVIFDSPDQAGVLGYHTEGPDGGAYAKVFVDPVLDNGGGILDGGQSGVSVASVLSHEAAELFIDASVNGWYDGPTRSEGSSYAAEIADPVQGDTYPIVMLDGAQVLVSNFVGPAWFDELSSTNARRDWMGITTKPFEIARGGYCIVRQAPGSEREVFAAVPPPAWLLATKRHPASRLAKRATRARRAPR
jgi:hypothetical protein